MWYLWMTGAVVLDVGISLGGAALANDADEPAWLMIGVLIAAAAPALAVTLTASGARRRARTIGFLVALLAAAGAMLLSGAPAVALVLVTASALFIDPALRRVQLFSADDDPHRRAIRMPAAIAIGFATGSAVASITAAATGTAIDPVRVTMAGSATGFFAAAAIGLPLVLDVGAAMRTVGGGWTTRIRLASAVRSGSDDPSARRFAAVARFAIPVQNAQGACIILALASSRLTSLEGPVDVAYLVAAVVAVLGLVLHALYWLALTRRGVPVRVRDSVV
ncbi:hypothetical protein HQQ81_02665 [Microbacteriaceae bacterium VKM Ac-2854]|nr:hypothetical protein [Microbacteriaceae bacterium VKM Ac-2854]